MLSPPICVVNLLFAGAFLLCGPDALNGSVAVGTGPRLLEAFFFSVQTLSTIGYGDLSPNGLAPNLIVTLEAIVGLLTIALATGLVFARFSRPRARIVFSERALIAPYRNITAFEFRVANERNSQLTNVNATVVLSRWESVDGKRGRRFHPLTLEREQVMFLPLHWVVVHPIDEQSPLYGVTGEQLLASDAEFLILLTGLDEDLFADRPHALVLQGGRSPVGREVRRYVPAARRRSDQRRPVKNPTTLSRRRTETTSASRRSEAGHV